MITVVGDLVVDFLVSKGATNFATDTDGRIQLRPGGQANNVARFVASEGAPCRLIGKVGSDPLGTYLIDEASKHGVDCEVAKDAEVETGKIVILVDEQTGERSMITDRGANTRLTPDDLVGIENSDILYMSGYAFFEDKPREAMRAAKEVAREAGIPVALDPSSTYFLQRHKEAFLQFLDGVTFLFPSYEEGVLLTGEKEPQKIVAALRKFVPMPVLTCGEEGCWFYRDGSYVALPPPKVSAVDTTGAGDSFAGSFLATYWRTRDVTQAAKRAVEVAAQTVTYVGAFKD
ncbi:carbohydrate kinase family protein [Numidum massiliense]|uniref:carbohydrate kinase family protein n=1 Tax=Numidum massiliense TaxID=1522315 RepID=UPI0006D54DBB|nr:carbohydrate kinase family protein [Numidum massiliense]